MSKLKLSDLRKMIREAYAERVEADEIYDDDALTLVFDNNAAADRFIDMATSAGFDDFDSALGHVSTHTGVAVIRVPPSYEYAIDELQAIADRAEQQHQIGEGNAASHQADVYSDIINVFIAGEMGMYDREPDQFHDTNRSEWEAQVMRAADQLDDFLDTLVLDLHNGEFAI